MDDCPITALKYDVHSKYPNNWTLLENQQIKEDGMALMYTKTESDSLPVT